MNANSWFFIWFVVVPVFFFYCLIQMEYEKNEKKKYNKKMGKLCSGSAHNFVLISFFLVYFVWNILLSMSEVLLWHFVLSIPIWILIVPLDSPGVQQQIEIHE